MVENNYLAMVNQHIADCRALNLDDSELAFSIIHSAENFDDSEVEPVLTSLPEKIKMEINSAIKSYKKTGEYYVISSTGVSKNLSELMERLSKLV